MRSAFAPSASRGRKRNLETWTRQRPAVSRRSEFHGCHRGWRSVGVRRASPAGSAIGRRRRGSGARCRPRPHRRARFDRLSKQRGLTLMESAPSSTSNECDAAPLLPSLVPRAAAALGRRSSFRGSVHDVPPSAHARAPAAAARWRAFSAFVSTAGLSLSPPTTHERRAAARWRQGRRRRASAPFSERPSPLRRTSRRRSWDGLSTAPRLTVRLAGDRRLRKAVRKSRSGSARPTTRARARRLAVWPRRRTRTGASRSAARRVCP